MIYHITDATHWEQALESGLYDHPHRKTDGFLHASTASQLPATLERHYASSNEVILLHIVERRIKDQVKWELAPNVGEEFPHIYGRLSIEAIEDVSILLRRPDGTWDIPTLV